MFSKTHRFILAGDDNCELWLGTSEDPSTKRKIAFVDGWTNRFQTSKYPSQTSNAIDLIGDQNFVLKKIQILKYS